MKTILIAVTALLWVSATRAETDLEFETKTLFFSGDYKQSKREFVSTCVEASQRGLKVGERDERYKDDEIDSQTYRQKWLWEKKLYVLTYMDTAPIYDKLKQVLVCRVYNSEPASK